MSLQGAVKHLHGALHQPDMLLRVRITTCDVAGHRVPTSAHMRFVRSNTGIAHILEGLGRVLQFRLIQFSLG
jgi:hypothetical protein